MKSLITLAASAVILMTSIGLAQAQQSSGGQMTQQQAQQGQGMMQQRQRGQRMMGQRGWRSDRMGPSMMGQRGGMMGHAGMMRIMFAIIDADGDGALSLEEVQEAHARIFKHVDADGDGRVTLEEIHAFFRGTPSNAAADDMDEMNNTGE
jgi:opacity protein-like surface antigen